MRDFGIKQKTGDILTEGRKEKVSEKMESVKDRAESSGEYAKARAIAVASRVKRELEKIEEDVEVSLEETENAYIRIEVYYRENHIVDYDVDDEDFDVLVTKLRELVEKVKSRNNNED